MLITIAVLHNLDIYQMDVKAAFLIEEIYIEQPERFIVKGQEYKVCKLVKSLYSLEPVSYTHLTLPTIYSV